MGKIDEERFSFPSVDQRDGFLDIPFRELFLIDRTLDSPGVSEKFQRDFSRHPGRSHVVAVRETEELIESMTCR